MHAAVRSSIAVGAVVATAGAIVAAPTAPAPEIRSLAVQSHDIELAALPAGAIVLALVENQVGNAVYVIQSVITVGASTVQAAAATVTAPLTFIQALTAADGTPLKAIGVTAASIADPLFNAGTAIIDPIYAIGGRALPALITAGYWIGYVGIEALGLGLMTVRGVMAAPDAAVQELAASGDLIEAISAGANAFGSYFGAGLTDLTNIAEYAREDIYNKLMTPLEGTATQYSAAVQANANRIVTPSASENVQLSVESAPAETVTDVDAKGTTTPNLRLSTARKVAESLKQPLAGVAPSAATEGGASKAAASADSDESGTSAGKHALKAGKQGSSHGNGGSQTGPRHAKKAS